MRLVLVRSLEPTALWQDERFDAQTKRSAPTLAEASESASPEAR